MEHILIKLFKQLMIFVIWESVLAEQYRLVDDGNSNKSYEKPLFLSAYIENADIETGRLLSKVGPLPNAPSVLSFSGFITVNKEHNSNIFFWFFPAMNNDLQAPIIIWLQGGPGTSGVMGVFYDHGPYFLHPNHTAGPREHTWANEFHVLYVDSPVGTGFSFTDDKKGYATNQDQITEGLYSFLEQFFEVYYEYRSNDLYVCGESYGGKHVAYLGYKIHLDGPPADTRFKGIAIGNPIIDMQYAISRQPDYMYQLGILDRKQADIINARFDLMVAGLEEGDSVSAVKEFKKIMAAVYQDAEANFFREFSGYESQCNLLYTKLTKDYMYYKHYIQSAQTRKAVHVGNLPFREETTVQKFLEMDMLQTSIQTQLARLMDNYKVLVHSGQLDLIFPYVITGELLQNLTWKFSEEYKSADRRVWRINDHVAGYVRSVGNFSEVLVRNAGHMVPHDQPVAALELITRFIKDAAFN